MGIKNVAKVNKSEFRLSITLRIAPPIPNICASNTISLRPRWLTYYFPSFTYENKTLSMKHLHHHMAPYVEYLNLIWCWQEIVVDPYVEYVNLIWSWQEIFVAPYVKYLKNLNWCWQEIVVALYVKYLNLIWCVGKWWCMCAMTIMDNRLRENVMATRAIKGVGSIGMHGIRKGKFYQVAISCTWSHWSFWFA